MINKRPIFLNCFSRGGSNILWNIFLSHPDVCSPIQETLQIFGAGLTHATWEGYLVALLSGQPRLFNQWHLQPPRPISRSVGRLIDSTLHKHKMKSVNDPDMGYKDEKQRYTVTEVAQTRLVAKNNNGLVFLSDLFCTLYPDATFVALVRHPLALYESHRRRRITHSPAEFAHFYNAIAGRMLADAARLDGYHIVRFEDLVSEPISWTKTLCAWAGLDFDKIEKLRFKAKAHMQANGRHTTSFTTGRHYWFALDEVHTILDPGVNSYQMSRVETTEQEQLLSLTATIAGHLGYDNTA